MIAIEKCILNNNHPATAMAALSTIGVIIPIDRGRMGLFISSSTFSPTPQRIMIQARASSLIMYSHLWSTPNVSYRTGMLRNAIPTSRAPEWMFTIRNKESKYRIVLEVGLWWISNRERRNRRARQVTRWPAARYPLFEPGAHSVSGDVLKFYSFPYEPRSRLFLESVTLQMLKVTPQSINVKLWNCFGHNPRAG